MKAIIYVRVSSDDQVENTSLDDQERLCRHYCADKGIEVLEVFSEEGKSAKSTDRRVFLEAIEYCRKNKRNVQAFVVARMSRFARKTEDHFTVRKVLRGYGISLHSVAEPINETPAGGLTETLLAAIATFENEVRSEQCSSGMGARIRQGLYPFKAPMGYRSHGFKKDKEKMTLPPDPDPKIFPILQKGLKEMASGMYSKTGLARRLDQLGLSKERGIGTTARTTHTLLGEHRLKFYAGWIYNPFEKGNIYEKGLHKAMINDLDVARIMEVLSGKARSMATRRRENPHFPLRGTVQCGGCEKLLTASIPCGNGGQYFYYHCHNKNCGSYAKSIPKDDVEKDFKKHLAKITPRLDWMELFKETVIDLWREKGKTFELEAEHCRKQLAMLEEKRKRIFVMREDGSYTQEEFQERKASVEEEVTAARISLDKASKEQFNIEEAVAYATASIGDLGKEWFDLSPNLRSRFQKLVFPTGIAYTKESGFRTAQLGHIYELNRRSASRKSALVVYS